MLCSYGGVSFCFIDGGEENGVLFCSGVVCVCEVDVDGLEVVVSSIYSG